MTLAGRLRIFSLIAFWTFSGQAAKERPRRETPAPEPAAAAAPWHFDDAPYRAVVKLEFDPDIPETGIAINLPEFGYTLPNAADVLLTDAEGKPQPLAFVWRGEGQSVLLLAQRMTPKQDYYLYFGGKKSRGSKPWTPLLSLFLETRRIAPGAKLDSATALHTLWQQNSPADGAGWVDSIFHGANPYGESENFISHFSGYLKTDKLRASLFYTLSSDASFVYFNDKLEFGWPGIHQAHGTDKNYHGKVVNLSGKYTHVDYYQAKVNSEGGATMALGWKHNGRFENISNDYWLHPGTAKLVRIENIRGLPVPVPSVRIISHVGFGGEWLCETSCSMQLDNLTGWTQQWEFDDGATFTDTTFERMTVGTMNHRATLRLRRGKDELVGIRRFNFTPKSVQESIQNDGDVRHYNELIAKEDPARMSLKALRAYLVFLEAFGTDQQTAKFADAYLKKGADATDPLWLNGQIARLRTLAQTDPKQALIELRKIDPAARQRFARPFNIFELDLLVYLLRDASVIDRAQIMRMQNPKSDVGQLAAIRIGDLYRLEGRLPQAIEQYRSVQKSITEATAGCKLPAQDSAFSISINKLIEDGYRVEAEQKLLEWEIHHPMARLDTDFFLQRARILMLSGRWREAQLDLDSFQKLQPQGPYQVDVDFYRARCLFELGDKAAARKIWADIAKQYPNHQMAGPAFEWSKKQ